MKNNKVILIVALIVSAAIAFYFLSKGTSKTKELESTMVTADRGFSFKEIDKITTISLKRKDYPELVFTKKGDEWIINNKFRANLESMKYLLTVLKGVTLKYIPPNSMVPTLKKDIEKNGIVVKLYQGEEKVRQYSVGTEFGDGSDTPYLMEGEDQPYMMYLPGFDGSVRRRMSFKMAEWRSKIVFEENPDMIKSLEVNYLQDKKSSFTITRFNDGFKITNGEGKLDPRTVNNNTVSAYLDFYRAISAEYNDTDNPERPNILNKQIFCTITIIYKDNTQRSFDFYSYGDLLGDFETISPSDINPDNKFFVLSPEKELFLLQQRVVGKVLQPIWFFF